MDLAKRQLVGLFGCALLLIGVFLPIVSVPIMGGMNYFQNGHGDGTILLIFAALSAVFLFQKKYIALWFTATGCLGMLLFTFLTFYLRMAQIRAEMERGLEGNPFAGLGRLAMQSVQMQWGWAVLVLGSAMLFAAAAWRSDIAEGWNVQKKVVAVAMTLVIVAAVAYSMNLPSKQKGEAAQSRLSKSGENAAHSQEDAASKAYIANIKLYDLWGGYSYGEMTCTEFEGRKCAAFTGKLKNQGDRALSEVEVTVYFPDKEGKTVFEKSYSPVLASTGGYVSFRGNGDPLKPGYIREFSYVVPDCPSECVPNRARFEVTKIEFYKPMSEP